MIATIYIVQVTATDLPRPATARDDALREIAEGIAALASRRRCAVARRVHNSGISLGHLQILWILQEHGPLPVSRLADWLGIGAPNATGLLDRMAQRGLVERVRDAEDRRVVLARATPTWAWPRWPSTTAGASSSSRISSARCRQSRFWRSRPASAGPVARPRRPLPTRRPRDPVPIRPSTAQTITPPPEARPQPEESPPDDGRRPGRRDDRRERPPAGSRPPERPAARRTRPSSSPPAPGSRSWARSSSRSCWAPWTRPSSGRPCRDRHRPPGNALYMWVVTAYLLTSTISVPFYGKLSDTTGASRCS